MKKVLITGANGLLGQKLVQLLQAKPGYYVVATGRGPCRVPMATCQGHYAPLDVTDQADVQRVLQAEMPHAVMHTAAMTNVDQCETDHAGCDLLNVTAVQHLVHACNAVGAFLLHLSTDFIFDGLAGPYTEDAQPAPLSYYGHSKLQAEHLVQQHSQHWAIARTVLVYGLAHDMSRSNIILWVKKSLEEGKAIKVVTDQWRTPTLAEDLAQGCYLIVDQQATGIFNISGAELLTPHEMALATAHHFQLDASLIGQADSSTFSQPAQRPPRTGFVITKAQQQLGYQPHTFAQGLALLGSQLAVAAG